MKSTDKLHIISISEWEPVCISDDSPIMSENGTLKNSSEVMAESEKLC